MTNQSLVVDNLPLAKVLMDSPLCMKAQSTRAFISDGTEAALKFDEEEEEGPDCCWRWLSPLPAFAALATNWARGVGAMRKTGTLGSWVFSGESRATTKMLPFASEAKKCSSSRNSIPVVQRG